jgi:hypothetical protein
MIELMHGSVILQKIQVISSITALHGRIRAPGVLGPGVAIGGSTPQGGRSRWGGRLSAGAECRVTGSAECTQG